MNDKMIIRRHKKESSHIKKIAYRITAILIILLFLHIVLYIYQKRENDSFSILKEEIFSEDDIYLFTDEENLLLTELEKIQADLKIHP